MTDNSLNGAVIKDRIKAMSANQQRLLAQQLKIDQPLTTERTAKTKLVAFINSNTAQDKQAGPEIKELKSFLKERLPEYMVPAQFCIVDDFPKLANGKIDLSLLLQSLPETAIKKVQPAANDGQPKTDFEQKMIAIWEAVLQTEDIQTDDNFFELGGDSILSINVVSRARQQQIMLSPGDLFDYPSIAELSSFYEENKLIGVLNAGATTIRSPIKGDSLTPLMMVHGRSRLLSSLMTHLNPDQPIYFLPAHWDSGTIDFDASIAELAQEGLAHLRKAHPHGPYLLGGFSLGCVIAFGMAQQLRQEGEEVELLLLLDPPVYLDVFKGVHGDVNLWDNKNVEDISTKSDRHIGQLFQLSLMEKLHYIVEKLQGFTRHYYRKSIVLGKFYFSRSCGLLNLPIPASLKRAYVSIIYNTACKNYDVKPYDSPLLLFRSIMADADPDKIDTDKPAGELWQSIAQGGFVEEEYHCAHAQFQSDPQWIDKWTKSFSIHLEELYSDKSSFH